MNDLLNNTWFVSIASTLLGVAIGPIYQGISDKIRARYGIFSGTYIAVTTVRGTKDKIVELVHCKHINNRVTGTIQGFGYLLHNESEVKPNNNQFTFKGTVDERLLVIAYQPERKENLCAGSLTLYGNPAGIRFSGTWCGLEEDVVESLPCVWVKQARKLHPTKNYEEILMLVQTDFMPTTIMMENGSGKTIALKGFNRKGINE